jgi:hypothetical protein
MTDELEPAGPPSLLARAFAAGVLALGGAGAVAQAGAGAAAAIAAGIAAAVPYAEAFLALAEAELRHKPQLFRDGTLAGARSVRPEITEEELALQLVEDDELRALMFRVLEAGRRTARPDKLRWLGVVLGWAAADRDRIDETRLLVDALDDLEAPQIVTLALLNEPPANPTHPWTADELAARSGLDEGVVLSCLGTITRHGLGRTHAGFGGGIVYELTDQGRAVLTVIRRQQRPGD